MAKNIINVSKPELVYDVGELSYEGRVLYIDGSCCTQRRSDGKIDFLTTYIIAGSSQYVHFVGTAAPMMPEDLEDVRFIKEIGYTYDAHSDAAYCAALDKYILILQSARQVIMFMSDDGANYFFYRSI